MAIFRNRMSEWACHCRSAELQPFEHHYGPYVIHDSLIPQPNEPQYQILKTFQHLIFKI